MQGIYHKQNQQFVVCLTKFVKQQLKTWWWKNNNPGLMSLSSKAFFITCIYELKTTILINNKSLLQTERAKNSISYTEHTLNPSSIY